MEHVIVRTDKQGIPTAVISRGRESCLGAEPVRWFERVNWWETSSRMPRGQGCVDVEVLQVQVWLGRNRNSTLATMVLERDGLGGAWRLRESLSATA
ncbi:hypothetical protein FDW83_18420 [Pseudarthrobacter sp. NamE2]|uniref:hypothetical protein n=1 Tax=Pseudarthrobacter sp. NamE2 TaxID=2576838 RepID=UPI0010FE8F38|nr:hypothetical protein [Pseudarthrobacter sp. NamE2]TLM80681.1 hypothetical protein FDW83_18420 [Pseudarthrobacter sp. NamE2]